MRAVLLDCADRQAQDRSFPEPLGDFRRREVSERPAGLLRLRMSFFGKPAPTFPGHAFTFAHVPYRKTGSHFSGTCFYVCACPFSENRFPLFRDMRWSRFARGFGDLGGDAEQVIELVAG